MCLLPAVVGACPAGAGVVTVDVAAKSAASDVTALDPKVVRVIGKQVGVYIQSTALAQQNFLVRFDGLTEPDYDVYVNGDFVCTKPAKDLAEGLEGTTPESIADVAVTRCLKAVKDKVKEAYDNLHARSGPEPWRAAYTLNQAITWISLGLMVDDQYRSLEVILAPAGRPLAKMVFATRRTAEEAARVHFRTCELLQDARDRMYDALKDPALRNYVVDSLTPVRLTASYSLVNGKPRVTAMLANDVNFAISGKLTMAAPQGFKVKAGKLAFAKLDSGQTFTAPFALEPTKKGTKPPESVRVNGEVRLVSGRFEAKLRLTTTAALKK